MNGGNEATQLLRKMINCRSLGIPFNPQLHLQGALGENQPMALLKVSRNYSHFIFPADCFNFEYLSELFTK